jgi:hypothetical protein
MRVPDAKAGRSFSGDLPQHAVPLTVVVATTQRWPEVRLCLDSLHNQAVEAGAEVLVADGHGEGLPDTALARYPQVSRLRMPGASVFQLRAAAMARAQGEVVAVTEDHCRLAAGWCRSILEAHRDYPDAAVIGGVVENGADRRLLDWANFFVANGASMPPVPNGAHRRVALQATVSYKKHVVPRDVPPSGRMEWMLNQDLRRRGEKLVSDNRILVHHIQSFGFHEACAIHYHDSRSIAGFRLQRIGVAERLVRLAACPAMPPLLLLRTIVPIIRKRRCLGRLLLSLPLIAVLVHCRAAGALAGFLCGAGESPRRIH